MSCRKLICDCNGTIRVDAGRLSQSLGESGPLPVHSELCRREAERFLEAAQQSGDLLVACTQEAPEFGRLAGERAEALRFVNIREHAGWSSQGSEATPKIAALLAAASLPDPEPVPNVTYRSDGRLLIAGPAELALMWATELAHDLEVSVLLTDKLVDAELPFERTFPVYSGKIIEVSGYLGRFTARWEQSNAIDLDACVRCGACERACPESAITAAYQVDAGKCTGHRQCVAACGEVRAIDFARESTTRSGEFDLIFDLDDVPMFSMPQPPQGYFAPGSDSLRQAKAVRELVGAIGEFEKPRYFRYDASICAHSRSKLQGCNQCIDVCSTRAILPAGDRITVEAHLCMGCGGCATVCPSGALSYAFPAVPYQGERLQAALTAFAAAGGKDACVLLHDSAGAELIARAARRGKGLPARVIPLQVHHIAACGLDLALGSLALGANQFVVLASGEEPIAYREALSRQFSYGMAFLRAIGFGDEHLHLMIGADAIETALWALPAAPRTPKAATFKLFDRKRTTLRFAIEHLAAQAPQSCEVLAMPAGAPFGSIDVNRDTCTLCMACVGACPESALVDGRDLPQLRFVETNCVQCGLCEQACPEDAISLVPRLLLTAEAKSERLLNEDRPFHCERCGKAFATTRMIENMSGRLAGHSMFSSPEALKRVRMCADCRVIDMMEHKNEVSVFDLKP